MKKNTSKESEIRQIFRRFGQDAREKKEYCTNVVIIVAVSPICSLIKLLLSRKIIRNSAYSHSHTWWWREISEFKISTFSHYFCLILFSLLSSSPFFSSFIFEKNVYDDLKSIRRMKPSIHSFKRLKSCEIEKTITILNIILNGINRNY